MPQKKTKVIREIAENPFIQGQAKRKKLRVAAYCRVSTERKNKSVALKIRLPITQILFRAIRNGNLPEFLRIVESAALRYTVGPEFMKMIEHCQRHKIDLIFTKSLSRFSRNTLDSIKYIRLLKSLNVTIEFEKEGLNTSDVSSEIYLTWFSAFAQAESESISQNVTMGKRRPVPEGHFAFRYQSFLGYRAGEMDSLKLVIEQATIVYGFFTFSVEIPRNKLAKSLEADHIHRQQESQHGQKLPFEICCKMKNTLEMCCCKKPILQISSKRR